MQRSNLSFLECNQQREMEHYGLKSQILDIGVNEGILESQQGRK